jgi:hypothetical protein
VRLLCKVRVFSDTAQTLTVGAEAVGIIFDSQFHIRIAGTRPVSGIESSCFEDFHDQLRSLKSRKTVTR